MAIVALLVDAIIALTLIEGVVLLVYHRRTARGLPPRDYLLNLLSGLCLMAALQATLQQVGWHWVVTALLAAGLAHGADLWMRWQRARRM